jgi:putative pyruvate formate lyase activating enzyme
VCPKIAATIVSNDEIAACYSGRLPIVSSYTAHSAKSLFCRERRRGQYIFRQLHLRCVYCQNYQISQTWKTQKKNETTHERMAEMMLELQAPAVTTSGFVSPTHFRAADGAAIFIGGRKRSAPADCLQHERLRFGRSFAPARRHR